MIVGENPEALGRKDGAEAIDGLLDQRAIAEESQDLFGAGAAAARPESGAAAAGENQAVKMIGSRHFTDESQAWRLTLLNRITADQLQLAIPTRPAEKVLDHVDEVIGAV